MKRMTVLVVLAIPLLMGQTCGTTAPVPVAQDFGGGLQPGLYSGQSQFTMDMRAYGYNPPPRQQTTDTSTTSLTVGPSGLPCDSKGREVSIGLTDSAKLGTMSVQMAVTGLTVDNGKVSVDYDASLDFSYPDGTRWTLTGLGRDIYTQSGSQILSESHLLLAGTVYDWSVSMDLRSMATVAR